MKHRRCEGFGVFLCHASILYPWRIYVKWKCFEARSAARGAASKCSLAAALLVSDESAPWSRAMKGMSSMGAIGRRTAGRAPPST